MRISILVRRTARSVALAAALGGAMSAQALVFNLTPTGNAQADAGFAAAAQFWQNIFSDPVTVNINAGFAALGPGILGQAGSAQLNTTFAAVKAALSGDASSADDAVMVGGLPAGATYSKLINRTSDNPNGSGSATPYVHGNISQMRVTNANAKAIGLLPANQAGADAAITFSSLFAWDFDPSDGIGAGLIDFVGVAIHELGHAMGFVSGVDILDINSPPVNGPFAAAQFDPFASLLDFTRCSAASEGAGADMDWTASSAAKDFAIDGQCTALISNAWSLGSNFGDGRQASHWKDNLGIGIMDPTSAPAGSANVVTANDIRAFDVIGWTMNINGVPEPGGVLLFGTALLAAGAVRRRRAG